MYSSWDTEQERQNFLLFWAIFCPFTPLTTWKIKILKKWKTPGDIILHKCVINDNHMMYGSWNMKHDRKKFLSFWAIFCPFTPLTTWKNKMLKKWKTPGDIILHKCVINDNHMMYGSWNMKHDRKKFLSFWAIFCPFTPLTTWKNKMLKKWKITRRYHHFTRVHHISWSYAILCSWDMVCGRCNLHSSF